MRFYTYKNYYVDKYLCIYTYHGTLTLKFFTLMKVAALTNSFKPIKIVNKLTL